MKQKRLEKMFNYINRELFAYELNIPYIHVLTNKQCKKLWHVPIDGIITGTSGKNDFHIAIHKDLTNNEAFDTMVHEMIHQHLIMKYDYGKHGKKFKKVCQRAIDMFYYKML
jgi:hypothetical protein